MSWDKRMRLEVKPISFDISYNVTFKEPMLDLIKEEVHDTYYIGPEGTQINVYDLAYNDTSFFAATEKGVYYIQQKWVIDDDTLQPVGVVNSVSFPS